MQLNKNKFILFILFISINLQIINAAQPAINKAELIVIPHNYSLDKIQKIIESSNVPYDKIAVFFDYDQTLNLPEIIEKKKVSKIRGGKGTEELIHFLNKNHINWFINTAAGTGPLTLASLVTTSKRMGLSLPNWINSGCFNEKMQSYSGKKLTQDGVEYGVCNNIVSAGYDKPLATEFALQYYKIAPYPSLIIFADDGPMNVLELYNHFTIGDGQNKGLHFVGVFYEPPVREIEAFPEPGFDEAKEEINKIIAQQPKPKSHVQKLVEKWEGK